MPTAFANFLWYSAGFFVAAAVYGGWVIALTTLISFAIVGVVYYRFLKWHERRMHALMVADWEASEEAMRIRAQWEADDKIPF